MRKVVLYELLSLDGVAEDPDAFFHDFDDVMVENLRRVIADQDTVLLGRRTFEEWAAYWPGSTIEPFASFINTVRKYIVTTSAPAKPWANAAVADAPLHDFIADLRHRPGRDIGVHGSVMLAHAMLEQNLVDELRLVVAPALAGTGRRLFDGLAPLRFRLTRSVASPAGYLLLDYEVIPATGHPHHG